MLVQWFRQAAPYIHSHRGKTFIIYFSGEVIAHSNFKQLIEDITLLHSLGIKLILIHGARIQINQILAKHQFTSQFKEGLRITPLEQLPSILAAVGSTHMYIESLFSIRLTHTPMANSNTSVVSGNFVTAKPVGIIDGIDFGHTGKVRRIDTQGLIGQLSLNHILLLSNIGYSPTGEIFNLNAEDIAFKTAMALKADKLILLIDHMDFDCPREINAQQFNNLPDTLPPYIKSLIKQAIFCSENQVKRVHLLNFQTEDILLTELFTRDGAGIMISEEKFEVIRSATIEDVLGILEIIAPLEANGILVKRSREQLELEIEYFTVIERDYSIIGCAALYPYAPDFGELACLAIHPDYRKSARGSDLLRFIEKKAHQLQMKTLFILTTQSSHWFKERGFQNATLDNLPINRKMLYNYQRNSQVLQKTLFYV